MGDAMPCSNLAIVLEPSTRLARTSTAVHIYVHLL